MFQDPGAATISIVETEMSFPQSTFEQIVKALGSNGDTIDCDAKTNLTFTIGGIDFEVSV
jgi:hypothetical protein